MNKIVRSTYFNRFPVSALIPNNLVNDIGMQLRDILVGKALYSVDVSRIRQRFGLDPFRKVFRNLPKVIQDNDVTREEWKDGAYYGFLMYKNIPVILVASKGTKCASVYTISTKNGKVLLDEFSKRLCRMAERSEFTGDGRWYSFDDYGGSTYHTNRSKRTFDDVFVPKAVKSEILSSITDFTKNKSWFLKHNIPYHFGMMLYGPPGTGKSSMIASIANYFHLVPYYVTPDSIHEILRHSNMYIENFSQTDFLKMIIIEDIDSLDFVCDTNPYEEGTNDYNCFEEMKKNGGSRYSRQLSEFLNLIDGSKCMENVIWIMTTNHIGSINKSIIRPGRIDKSIHIDYVCPETMKEFIKYHYDSTPEIDFVRPELSFAEVQTDVMRGKDMQHILDKYCSKEPYYENY